MNKVYSTFSSNCSSTRASKWEHEGCYSNMLNHLCGLGFNAFTFCHVDISWSHKHLHFTIGHKRLWCLSDSACSLIIPLNPATGEFRTGRVRQVTWAHGLLEYEIMSSLRQGQMNEWIHEWVNGLIKEKTGGQENKKSVMWLCHVTLHGLWMAIKVLHVSTLIVPTLLIIWMNGLNSVEMYKNKTHLYPATQFSKSFCFPLHLTSENIPNSKRVTLNQRLVWGTTKIKWLIPKKKKEE